MNQEAMLVLCWMPATGTKSDQKSEILLEKLDSFPTNIFCFFHGKEMSENAIMLLVQPIQFLVPKTEF